MTTRRVLLICFALLLLSLGCSGAVGIRGGLPAPQVEAFPQDVKGAYHLFELRCSRCHTLERPLTAGVTSLDHWRAYVSRMRRNPGSGISPADGEKILVFLAFWAGEGKRTEGAQ